MFKSITPIPCHDHNTQVRLKSPALSRIFAERPAYDPSAGVWLTVGFAPVIDDLFVFDSSTGARVFYVEFRERLLPTKVIKTKVAERIAEIMERGGNKPKRNEIMQIRDDVVATLLPTAFIRSNVVKCMILGQFLVIGTPSGKAVDVILVLLRQILGSELKFDNWNVDAESWLTSLVLPVVGQFSASDSAFTPGKNTTLREDEVTFRVKNLDLDCDLVAGLINEGFTVRELDLHWDESMSFNLSDKMLLRRMSFVTDKVADDDIDAEIGLVALNLKKLLNVLINTLPKTKKVADPKAKEETDYEDDEL